MLRDLLEDDEEESTLLFLSAVDDKTCSVGRVGWVPLSRGLNKGEGVRESTSCCLLVDLDKELPLLLFVVCCNTIFHFSLVVVSRGLVGTKPLLVLLGSVVLSMSC